jgi:hypothetical protein
MIIEVKTKYTIKFTVEYHENSEGGMSTDSFGRECDNLTESIRQLELAQTAQSERDWVIVGRVETIVH